MLRHKLPRLTLILITAATIGLTPVFVVSQTASLSGRVTDAETGEALTRRKCGRGWSVVNRNKRRRNSC